MRRMNRPIEKVATPPGRGCELRGSSPLPIPRNDCGSPCEPRLFMVRL